MDFKVRRGSFYVRVRTRCQHMWYVKEFDKKSRVKDLVDWLTPELPKKAQKQYRVWNTNDELVCTEGRKKGMNKRLSSVVILNEHGTGCDLSLDLSLPDSWNLVLIFNE